ncbi:MAG: 4Fe-4S binding protein [Firmicutes bacterium]|nr:4Fe-4S binding protein [Bacillota bacterium]
MNISKIHAVYFSPCRSTAALTRAIADRAAEELKVPVEYYDFTLSKNRKNLTEFSSDELVIFGMPTYAGRIPNLILPIVQNAFQGNDALAVPVVTFGNRSYDNSLLELRNELEKKGFHTVAGGAFVSRHVFTDKVGAGRPDDADVAFVQDFAVKIAEKVSGLKEIPEPIAVPAKGHDKSNFVAASVDAKIGPYYTPLDEYGNPAMFLKATPVTDTQKCSRCSICARVCPMDAISTKDVTVMVGTCIKCQACVKRCPDKAKSFDDPAFLSHVKMLEENFSSPVEPEIYI